MFISIQIQGRGVAALTCSTTFLLIDVQRRRIAHSRSSEASFGEKEETAKCLKPIMKGWVLLPACILMSRLRRVTINKNNPRPRG